LKQEEIMVLCQISAPLFWGFRYNLNIDSVSSVEDIINSVIEELKRNLQRLNLIEQVEILENRHHTINYNFDFHIHDVTFDDIKKSMETIYICSH